MKTEWQMGAEESASDKEATRVLQQMSVPLKSPMEMIPEAHLLPQIVVQFLKPPLKA